MYEAPKFVGGVRLSTRLWNSFLKKIEDEINALRDRNFRKDANIAQGKFTSSYLQRMDVSSEGGASRVVELRDRDLKLTTKPELNRVRIGNTGYVTGIEYDFANEQICFTANSTSIVCIGSNGWAGIIQDSYSQDEPQIDNTYDGSSPEMQAGY